MISRFSYLGPVLEAYSKMNESFPKDVKKLLDTKYKPVYKTDGYDQFGVDINGKDRSGNPVRWRYPDRWYGSVEDLKKLLSAAKHRENEKTNTVKSVYDRNGFDVLGYDRNGFDINDTDIMGHKGSEFGTEGYDALASERDRQHRNVYSKEFMREINYKKKRPQLNDERLNVIMDAYRESMTKDNPKKYFEMRLKQIFVTHGKGNNISYDELSVNYWMNKFEFPEHDSFKMDNSKFIEKFVEEFKKQLSHSTRPKALEDVYHVNVSVSKRDGNPNIDQCVITVTPTDSAIGTDVSRKYLNRQSLMRKAKEVANRMGLIFPYSGCTYWNTVGREKIYITLLVTNESHVSVRRKTALMNAEDIVK